MIIVIDGPEKAGKTTFATELTKRIPGATYRHWGPVSPNDVAFSAQLHADSDSDFWFVWDRSWVSEHVYGYLLNRDRRLSNDPWLGEWLHGRAVMTNGIRIIYIPRDIYQLHNRRDTTDLDVNINDEYHMYYEYAEKYGWTILLNDYDKNSLEYNLAKIISAACNKKYEYPAANYVGPTDAKVIFVGCTREWIDRPDAWLPFSSPLYTKLARILGGKAFKCGWMEVDNETPIHLLDHAIVVMLGALPREWAKNTSSPYRICISDSALWQYASTDNTDDSLVDKLLISIGETI